MPRELFKGVKSGELDPDTKEHIPPENNLFDSELVNVLLTHYINKRDGRFRILEGKNFDSLEQKVESIIKDAGDKPQPQILIDTLTAGLKDESDIRRFTRMDYLTAVIQALYNLDYADEFVINLLNWPENGYSYVGWFLEGRPDRPLILNLYGSFNSCGMWAENCTFSLMHGAGIKNYVGGRFRGNVLREQDEDGQWETIG